MTPPCVFFLPRLPQYSVIFISAMISFTSLYVKHQSLIAAGANRENTHSSSNALKLYLYYIAIEGVLKAKPRIFPQCRTDAFRKKTMKSVALIYNKKEENVARK
ncbi:hypothetical protein RB195_008208 [Necator americanus]|uniref:Secreted protein n=1 Tax=Necator americanus TaxID=51031 RepID=A0ABR1CMG6_NECAM